MITGTNRVAETEVYLQEDISRYGKWYT
jgi:hypothetical protein